jgi:hypothetical protein
VARGRPSLFTQKLADEICERLGNGEPLAQICRDEKMPGLTTVYMWQNKNEEFSESIARAREAGYDHIATDGLMIVDQLDEDPQSRRIRADYRLKLLAKWDAKRYGDKLDLTSGGEKIGLSAEIEASRRRAAEGE